MIKVYKYCHARALAVRAELHMQIMCLCTDSGNLAGLDLAVKSFVIKHPICQCSKVSSAMGSMPLTESKQFWVP